MVSERAGAAEASTAVCVGAGELARLREDIAELRAALEVRARRDGELAAALREMMALLGEQRRAHGGRREDDAPLERLLVAIANSRIGLGIFRVAELLEAAVEEGPTSRALKVALEAAGQQASEEGAKSLGKYFARVRGQAAGGLRLVTRGQEKSRWLWAVERADHPR